MTSNKKITREERFAEALTVLCRAEPPKRLIDAWLAHDESVFPDLQDWVGESGAPWWCQGIAVIEAASSMADAPIEGSDEIEFYKWR